jgi:MerR family transcriptional regulator, light-induced transcriptional regulator
MTETSTETMELRQRFLEAQLAGDRRKALELISAAAPSKRFSPAVLRAHVIRPAQAEIGRLWETNAISIAQEHMATAISHLALAALFERDAPRPPNGCKVIVACVDGELHEFPARLVADEFDVAGYDVRFLGASVPADHLVSMITRERPDLIVLSATLALHADSVRRTVARIREKTGTEIPIAIGGQVCAWVASLADELGATLTGCDALDLVDDASELLGVAR